MLTENRTAKPRLSPLTSAPLLPPHLLLIPDPSNSFVTLHPSIPFSVLRFRRGRSELQTEAREGDCTDSGDEGWREVSLQQQQEEEEEGTTAVAKLVLRKIQSRRFTRKTSAAQTPGAELSPRCSPLEADAISTPLGAWAVLLGPAGPCWALHRGNQRQDRLQQIAGPLL
ncbi:hypothetical protein EYF80_023029 [Liparis tanakae]|uniref:Uncharacterized protein n=1 Tax=Liparis tanakae TaxID=230148 RepID=A0A4Z2HM04_9TELE|nr:hypothetical protein EYF80_023029 [Liparis tanakae]